LPSLLQTRLPGCLIPAYWAVTSTNWDTLINTRNAYPNVPVAVVLNIAGGVGSGGGAGTSVISAWTTLISRLTSSNIIVLGFVDTNGAADSEATVQARMDSWKTLYPAIDGVFFENMGIQTTNQTYYTNLANYAKNTKGFLTVGGNCKVAANVVADTWHSQTVPIDTFIVFDGEGLDVIDTSYSKYSALNNNQLGYISYGVPAIDTSWNSQITQYLGWIYYTTGTGTTPYNSFPTYFQDFISNLDTIGGGTTTGGGGGVGGTGLANDKFGIRKMYHTKTGGEEFFTNQDNILADASSGGRVQNYDGEGITKEADGSHQATGGSNGDLRLELWSPAYPDLDQRLAAAWRNVEVTIYTKYISQDGRNPPYHAQLYAKGGSHSTSRPCEGAAYKFRLSRTGNTTSYDKEICHASYAGNTNVQTTPGLSGGYGNGQWHGFKAVQYVTPENTVKLETYTDINCSDANGNLVIRNNWQLVNSRTDSGGWAADSAYSTDCSGCGRSSASEIMTGPYTVTNSSSVNYRRNMCAYRTDGVTSRFRYFSAREIDPTKPVTGDEQPSGGGGQISNDQFGIAKIYPTITNGYEWFMNMTGTSPNTDTTKFRMDTLGLSKNADGSFKFANSSPSMQVFQRNGYNATTTATSAANHSVIASRGYMQDASDLRNVECTIYVRLNNTPVTGGFQWITRGGRHLEPPPNCEGSALRGYLYDNGETLCSKEQWHSSFASATRGVGVGSLLGRWVGFKFIVATKTVSGTIVTNQQIWIDNLNNNQWTKIDERTDAGGWGNQGGTCQGAPDQLISWGGPIVAFDWNSFTDVDFKNMSVREIDPNAVPAGAPPGGNTSLCGS
jgi:hypothetical protein